VNNTGTKKGSITK